VLLLYQFEVSPFCDKIRRVLHYKRKPFETREVPPTETLTRLRKLNPVGKVPVLQHGDELVWDSSDIARYLDRVFPDPPLYPSGARERALCHFIEDWADESLYFFELWLRFGPTGNAADWSERASLSEPPLVRRAVHFAMPTLMRNVLKGQGLGRKPAERVLADLELHLNAITEWLGNDDWLVGDRLTLADIAVCAQLSCAGETGEGAALIASQPKLQAWMERVDGATAPVA